MKKERKLSQQPTRTRGERPLIPYSSLETHVLKAWDEEGRPDSLVMHEDVLAKYFGDEFKVFVTERDVDPIVEMLFCMGVGFLAKKNRIGKKIFSVRCDRKVWKGDTIPERVEKVRRFVKKGKIENPFGLPIIPPKETGIYQLRMDREDADELISLAESTGVPLNRVINLALRTELPESVKKKLKESEAKKGRRK